MGTWTSGDSRLSNADAACPKTGTGAVPPRSSDEPRGPNLQHTIATPMPRILFTLANLTVVVMGVTFVVGLLVGSRDVGEDPAVRPWMPYHFLFGLASALAVVFVHSLVVTYFIGTTRWCKEVTETYSLDPRLVQESTRLKRRSFPWSLSAMLVIVVVIALGAAADPATGRRNLEPWAVVHFIAASLGFLYVVSSFYFTWNNVAAHHALIDRIVEEVRRIRRERGLEVEATEPARGDEVAAQR